MSQLLTSYKVFIATPGGLEAERRLFKDRVTGYNESHAVARNCHFRPIGWEVTLGGIGRPQKLVNEELKSCDIFIMILWDRWGTPTGSLEEHASGTKEEFDLAMTLLADPAAPMSRVVIFFKTVEARQLSDPGVQLNAVLEFKKQLDASRQLLYETFDQTTDFGERMLWHLADWVRKHEGDLSVETVTSSSAIDELNIRSGSTLQDMAEISELIGRHGRSNTEIKLAENVVNSRSMHSFELYGTFLFQEKRYSDAHSIFRQMQKVAESAGDISWAATALARQAGIFRAEQKYSDAEMRLRKALEMKNAAGDTRGARAVRVWLGDLFHSRDRHPEAADSYKLAFENDDFFHGERKPEVLFKYAKSLGKIDKITEALDIAQQARDIYSKVGSKDGVQSVKMWRKSLLALSKSPPNN